MALAPELRTHSQRVCTLYKAAMRLVESYYVQRYIVRYHQVQLRHDFDKNKCVCDPKDQRRLLFIGEYELFMKQNPFRCQKFPYSHGLAGGVAEGREVLAPDWIIDYWHPLEKAQYPEYFARRECRKNDYIKKWNCGVLR